ncbi:MAG: ATP-binding protein [Endomicrobiaceae bacterium]|nr:ATP-binding protein [Endomicrobiaceae bacterium]
MNNLEKDAVLKIGEVYEVDGMRVFIEVNKRKNSSELFFDGTILKNIAVNSFIEIKKGFLSIIGKVEGERIEDVVTVADNETPYKKLDRNRRILIVSLLGYINREGKFTGGAEELPLVANEAFLLTKDKINFIHSIVTNSQFSISICSNDAEEINVNLPIDGLFNTHIAIFGNTGTGKSNTLASLYGALVKKLLEINTNNFKSNCKFLLFDFNGEYTESNCIWESKKIYNLSTRKEAGNDKIQLDSDDFLDIEILSILASATDKTQKPFLSRTLEMYKNLRTKDNPSAYVQKILKIILTEVLTRKDDSNPVIIDFICSILPEKKDAQGFPESLIEDIYLNYGKYVFKDNVTITAETAKNCILYKHIDNFNFDKTSLSFYDLLHILKLQMIQDITSNRAQKDHIYPVVNRLEKHQKDIEKIITFANNNFWKDSNFIVINLDDVNLDMKKTIPLLIAKKIYSEHKDENNTKSLTIIIDEAHNILSKQSTRETEGWKDYRLETFEEIIKEGRKFGVFLTISSQRPNDISDTITSQAHNYFIHRLLNQKDLQMIDNAISYIDKITKDSIPTLPTGVCIFSGTATEIPLKIKIKELPKKEQPQSHTLKYIDIISPQEQLS